MACIAAGFGLAYSPTVLADDPPAVSKEGLHLQKNTKSTLVYIKPGVTWSQYKRVALLDCLVEFDKNLNPAAGLCDRWDVSPDLKVFRFHLRDDAVWEDDLAAWQAECEAARTAAAVHDLDYLGERRGEPCSLRWIYVHMIEEYARHNGHADLLREAIDGATGE
jgi:hypothetical protein